MGHALNAPDAIDPATTLVPNEHLRLSGMPPVPRSLAERIGRYTAFAPVDVVEWHPARRALLVARRHGSTTQLHRLDGPMGPLERLTDGSDPVREAGFEPTRGDLLVFARDSGGDEAAQLYALDAVDGRTTRLTDPSKKHGEAAWNHAGNAIAFGSTALDRTAGGREHVDTELSIVDPHDPSTIRRVAVLPGGGWQSFAWSPDDRTIYALDYRSVTDSAIWTIDVASGDRTRLLPKADRVGAVSYAELHVTRDGRGLVFTSDDDSEFRRLTTMDLATGECRTLTAGIDWDVVSVALQDGPADASSVDLAAIVVNVDGRHALRVFDLATGREHPLPALPDAARAGSVAHVRFARTGTSEIAFTVNSAKSPGDVYSIDLLGGGPAEQWTRNDVEGIDATGWREADLIRWPSFDGRTISGLINRPPARFAGPRPVMIHIHGGPESQATIGFLGINRHFVDDLGIAYIQPNVRGSAGYGKTFISLDDREKREDSVADIGALFDWIATQPDLDASRVLVAGRSYGGYMSLAVATHHAHRLVASIAIVGISHFTTFLERTESYRRDLRRVEYGDERDPAMRAFFDRISPLSNADRIRKPLFVVAGRNDPRVPYQESEQIVAKVRANGVPVWHLVADDEGHVFQKKPNIDYVACAQALFVERWLLDADRSEAATASPAPAP